MGDTHESSASARPAPPPLPGAPPAATLPYAGRGRRIPPTVIPWEARHQLGRVRAFWRTVFWVVGRNGRLGGMMAEPLDWRAARSFRWLAVMHAMLGWLLLTAVPFVEDRLESPRPLHIYDFERVDLVGGAILLLLQLATLPLLAGVISWFFCPRKFDTERQNRALALSCYLAGPLALILPWSLLTLGLQYAGRDIERDFVNHEFRTVWLVVRWLPFVCLWAIVVAGSRSIARRGWVGLPLTALLLPAAWAFIELARLAVIWHLVMWLLLGLSLT